MVLHAIDITIIIVYLLITISIGMIMQRRAKQKLDAYFLAERNVPWWMLGLSGCSSYVDIAGTMIAISVYFYVGFKAVWLIHILWGAFSMAMFMAYQAKYIRKAGVMTLAEWHKTRFGDNRETEHLRIAIAIFQAPGDQGPELLAPWDIA